MEDQNTIFRNEPFNIKLNKSIGKEQYGWEVRVVGEDKEKILKEIKQINEELKRQFKNKVEEKIRD